MLEEVFLNACDDLEIWLWFTLIKDIKECDYKYFQTVISI